SVAACVLVFCVAGAVAELLPVLGVGKAAVTSGVGKQVQGLNQLANQARDVSQNNAAGQNTAALNKNFGRVNQLTEDKASQANSANQAAGNQYGQTAANHDKAFNDAAKAASKSSSAAASQNAARSNAAHKATSQDAVSNTARNFRNNNVLSEGINYAYDKKYDLNNNQNGAYVFASDDNAHALDNVYDRSAAYDRNVDNRAAAASAADHQAADRRAQANQNQAANQAAHDKFGRNADASNQAAAAQSAHNNRVDTGAKSNQDNSLVARNAQDLFKTNLFRNTNQNRFGQQFGAADKQLGFGGLSPYYAGGLSLPGFGKDFASATGAVDQAYANDAGANGRIANQGLFGAQDVNRDAFARDQWLNDNQAAVSNNQANWLNDQGFAEKASNAQQAANAFNGDSAKAANAKNTAQKLSNFNENAKFADQERKNLADRNRNNRRLNYDKDQVADQLAYDNVVRQDNVRNAENAAENVAQTANAQQADNARANEAARNGQVVDGTRAAQGYQNQQAAADNRAAAARQGLDNSAWKVDAVDKRGNNAYQNQNLWDKGAQGYNNDAQFYGGGNFGAFGNRGAAYPGAYGGYYPGGYPGNGGFKFGGLSPGYNFY
ncbi:hypothetical protein BaRGS_00034219, partial [Batillaria attramentaria]